jgi:hypothetical protein
LAPIGQEFVWQEVWRQFGLNQSEIDEHFSGPAFLAWFALLYLHVSVMLVSTAQVSHGQFTQMGRTVVASLAHRTESAAETDLE